MADTKNKNIKKEEQTSNKVLAVFSAGALMLFINFYLFRYIDIPTSYHAAHLITLILFLLCAAGTVFFFVKYLLSKKNGTYTSEKLSDPLFLSGLLLSCTVCFAFMYFDYFNAMRFIYVFIPAVVLYYLIYNVYARNFFLLALTHGAAALLLFIMYKKNGSIAWKAACAAIFAVIAVLAVVIRERVGKNGVLKLKTCRIRVFDRASIPSKAFVYTLYGITLAIMITAIFVPASVVLYLFYAVLAFLACAAIYFTIRLI